MSENSKPYSRFLAAAAVAVCSILLATVPGIAQEPDDTVAAVAEQAKLQAEACAKLDDPKARGKMDGLLYRLLIQCDRQAELGQVRGEVATQIPAGPGATDVPVNDPTGEEITASHTQSETSVAYNPTTGTFCSGFNDSFHNSQGQGFTGFSRSTDGGASFVDGGAIGSSSFGDPAMVWRKSDGKFYIAALHSSGLGIWRSDDDCQTFTFVSTTHVGGGDDKELMAVDNNNASAFFGRLYVAWTNFTADGIFVNFSDDGGATWSTPVRLTLVGQDVQGAWPIVGPNGDVFVAWVRWNPFPSGPIDVEISRSTDGGASFARVTNPLTGGANPRDSTATSNCGRPAIRGNIRYLPSPQIAMGDDGVLHVIYVYDADGFNTGDVIDVYYRRSTDNGATWSAETKVNDDATTNDQFFPSLAVGPANIVTASWYDRRLDVGNLMIDYYRSTSFDGGVTWQPNERVSDVSTPVFLDPGLATCYHGDYDTQVHSESLALMIWSDDRNVQGGHNDPDVFAEGSPISDDFLVTAAPPSRSVCAPDDATYDVDVLQFMSFVEPVTLTTTGEPAGTTAGFSVNPVVPPGSSVLTISGTGGAAVGDSTITITGTSSPSAIVHEAQVALSISDQIPPAPTLTAPADDSTLQPLRPTFTWTAATQAASYTIEIATDAGFTAIVDSAAGLTATTYTPSSDLDNQVTYYWRVRALNVCGESASSATFSFLTVPAPGQCGLDQGPVFTFEEGFETGAPGWTSSGTSNSWASSTARVNTGTFSFHANDPSTVSDQLLVSPSFTVPPIEQAPISATFWNHQIIEDSGSGCFDGAVLEISTNGGTTWQRLESELLTDPYDGAVSTCCSNPLQTQNAWCGDPQPGLISVVDLAAFAGETAQLRFRLASDSSVSREGWYIDDVKVQGCVISLLFADGFESGDTSLWTATQN